MKRRQIGSGDARQRVVGRARAAGAVEEALAAEQARSQALEVALVGEKRFGAGKLRGANGPVR